MNTEMIINGLECCYNPDKWCDNCPYDKLGGLGCNNKLGLDALALIKNQLGEIRGLNSAIETLQGVAKDYENHNENLKREDKYLRERLAEEMEHKEDVSVEFTCVFGQPHKVSDCPITEEIDKAKADTVKKMQELIKERCIEGGIYPAFVASTIDKIAKEILEGTK